MAKESMKAREVKRAKLVAKYAERRAALKQIVRTGDPADAFEAAQTVSYTHLDVYKRQSELSPTTTLFIWT